jgi:hypothetical protein
MCRHLEFAMNKQPNRIPSALKHGGYSGMTLLPGEDLAAFKKLHNDLIAEYAPDGRSEEDIIESMARINWRKQNLSTYRLAALAKTRHSAIYSLVYPSAPLFSPFDQTETRSPEEVRAAREAAGEKARRELGTALELVEIGEVSTIGFLQDELSLIDRLDGMIDRCLKRLLFVRGLKSISSPSSGASPPSRIKRVA